MEELLVERGVDVEHAPVVRWVQRSLPLLADAAMFAHRSPGDRWFVDQTYVNVSGVWRYVYRAIDQDGQPGCWVRYMVRNASSSSARAFPAPRPDPGAGRVVCGLLQRACGAYYDRHGYSRDG